MIDQERRRELDEAIERFVAYGGVLDRQTRRYVAAWLVERLIPGMVDMDDLQPGYFRHFSAQLDEVLGDEVLQSVTSRHRGLAVQVVIDLLGWFRRHFGEVLVGHPFEDEERELQGWTVRHMEHVFQRWAWFTRAIGNHYTRDHIDAGFHSARIEAHQSLTQSEWAALPAGAHKEIERLFDDLLGQWDSHLQAKVLDFHLRRAVPLLNDLASNLHSKAREIQQLEELVEPFAEYAGRYWDLSRDLWSDEGFDVLRSYRELLDREEELKALADLLGKMREAERFTEEETFSQHVVHRSVKSDPFLRSELSGVSNSNDLNRLLPAEAALLGDATTETVFFRKFAESELQTFSFEHRYLDERDGLSQITETVSRRKEKGPFVVCVDTSGSMEGLPERVAKVLCFGIMKMAAQEARKAFLINFSTGVKTLDLLHIADSMGALVDFLRRSFHGGTDLSLALDSTLKQLEDDDYRDADVLIISDFVMYKIDAELLRRMEYRRVNRNTRFYALIVSDEPNEEVTDVFDGLWRVEPDHEGRVHVTRQR